MATDTLIIVLLGGIFLFFILFLSPLGDSLRNIGKAIRNFWKSSEK